MAIELIVDTPVLKGEKGDKGDTGSFDYTYLEEIVDEHLDNRFADVDASLDLKVDKEVGKSLVDDDYIAKLDNLETLDKTVVEKFNDKVEQSDLEENLIQIEGQLQNYIDEHLVTAGSGDMLKSVYDTDGDGVVDVAENANNADKVNNLTVETAVPPDAVFIDTTYEVVTTEKDGLMSSVDKIKLNGIESGANNTEIINNLTSTEIDKALSAAQGKNINDNINGLNSRVANLEEVKRVLLFEGAVKTGVITLNESMNNYRYLVFNISSSTSGGPFGSGIYPVLEMSTQSVLCYDSVPKATYNANAVTIYTGRFTKQSDTQLNTDIPIHNNIIRTEQSIGGGTEYYVREIWGVR